MWLERKHDLLYLFFILILILTNGPRWIIPTWSIVCTSHGGRMWWLLQVPSFHILLHLLTHVVSFTHSSFLFFSFFFTLIFVLAYRQPWTTKSSSDSVRHEDLVPNLMLESSVSSRIFTCNAGGWKRNLARWACEKRRQSALPILKLAPGSEIQKFSSYMLSVCNTTNAKEHVRLDLVRVCCHKVRFSISVPTIRWAQLYWFHWLDSISIIIFNHILFVLSNIITWLHIINVMPACDFLKFILSITRAVNETKYELDLTNMTHIHNKKQLLWKLYNNLILIKVFI